MSLSLSHLSKIIFSPLFDFQLQQLQLSCKPIPCLSSTFISFHQSIIFYGKLFSSNHINTNQNGIGPYPSDLESSMKVKRNAILEGLIDIPLGIDPSRHLTAKTYPTSQDWWALVVRPSKGCPFQWQIHKCEFIQSEKHFISFVILPAPSFSLGNLTIFQSPPVHHAPPHLPLIASSSFQNSFLL